MTSQTKARPQKRRVHVGLLAGCTFFLRLVLHSSSKIEKGNKSRMRICDALPLHGHPIAFFPSGSDRMAAGAHGQRGRGELERRACMQQGDQLPVGPSRVVAVGFVRACGEQTRCRRAARAFWSRPVFFSRRTPCIGLDTNSGGARRRRQGADAAGGAASGLCRAVVGRASARCFPHLHAWGSAPKGMSFGIGQPNNQALQCGARPAPVVGRRSMPFLHPPAIGVVVGLLVSPKAPCKSACAMQAALCSAVLLPLSL